MMLKKMLLKTKIREFTVEQRMIDTIQLVSNLMTEEDRILSLAYMCQCTNL
jgi:hypothetical protein